MESTMKFCHSTRSYCLFAAVGIFVVYFLQSTLFVAWFTVDLMRIRDRRNGIFFCYKHSQPLESRTPNKWSPSSQGNDQANQQGLMSKGKHIVAFFQIAAICIHLYLDWVPVARDKLPVWQGIVYLIQAFFLTFSQKLSLAKTRKISKLSQFFLQNSGIFTENSVFRQLY